MFTTKHLAFIVLVFYFAMAVFGGDRSGVQQVTQITSGPVGEIGPRCSPDGHYLAFEYFSPEHPNAVQVWLMPTKGAFPDSKALLGYTGKSYGEISWSPDSAWLSFVGESTESRGVISNQVFKVNITSGSIKPLTDFSTGTSLG